MAPKSFLPLSIIIGFALCYILTVVLACVLNCTQLNLLKRQYPKYVFVLSKLALLVIFLVNVTNFIISLIAVSIRVHDVHDALTPTNSSYFEVVNAFLIDFGVTSFRFKTMSLFWSKMIVDHKSILWISTWESLCFKLCFVLIYERISKLPQLNQSDFASVYFPKCQAREKRARQVWLVVKQWLWLVGNKMWRVQQTRNTT